LLAKPPPSPPPLKRLWVFDRMSLLERFVPDLALGALLG
jgi:hypothetical protein